MNGTIATVGACLEWFYREFGGKEKIAGELLNISIFDIFNLEIGRRRDWAMLQCGRIHCITFNLMFLQKTL